MKNTYVVANGNEIHSHAATYDEHGARTGNTPDMIARVEHPALDEIGQNRTACLFAASPELFEACKHALRQEVQRAADDDDHDRSTPYGEEIDRLVAEGNSTVRILRDALRKAEGR